MAFLTENFTPQSVGGGQSALSVDARWMLWMWPLSSTPADQLSWEPGPGALYGKALWEAGASPRVQSLVLAMGLFLVDPSIPPPGHPTGPSIHMVCCLPKPKGLTFVFLLVSPEIKTYKIKTTRDKDG